MSENADESREIACELDPEGRERRAGRLREELFPYLTAVEKESGGYALTFEGGEDALRPVTKHVGREAECCPFARYEMTIEPHAESIGVRITGDGVETMVEEGMGPLIDDVEGVSMPE